MKITASTYSFRRLGISQFEIIDLAKKIGFDAVEIVDLQIPEGYEKSEEEYARELKAYADKAGMPLSSFTIGADLFRENEVQALKHKVDIASILGVPFMRHDITWSELPEGKTYFDMIPFFTEKIREVTEYARSKGIKTCTENHGYISQDSDRVTALCKAVDNDNFGLLVDVGNFMCADQISVEAVKEAAPYAIYVHAKDFHYVSKEDGIKLNIKANEAEPSITPKGHIRTRGGNFLCACAVGDGDVNVAECIKILKEAGYDGYVAVEYESHFGDALEDIIKGYKFLRNII